MIFSKTREGRIFFWNMMFRTGLLILSSLGFVFLIQSLDVELVFTLIIGILVIGLQAILLTRYVLQLGRVMEQFIDSIGLEGSPEIQFNTSGAMFKGLKERSNAIKQGMNAGRLERIRYNQIMDHVINSADMGLLCFYESGEPLFVNRAAMNLLSGHSISHLNGIRSLNKKLWTLISKARPDHPEVIRITSWSDSREGPGREQLFSFRLKEVNIFDETYRLFSLQNIEEELHKNEADSWQKIIRVLTHEIMNAVAPMLSLTKSMQSRIQKQINPETLRIQEGLRVIESTGEGLMKFTEEYRRLSLLPSPKKERIILARAIESVVLLLSQEAREKEIEITTQNPHPGEVIEADKQQLEMVLLNLLKNSFEAMENNDEKRRLKIRIEKEGKRILLKVVDNGLGIPEDLIDQVFVPFFSTKEDGSGVGLSLARQIMNNHGGSIYLESNPRKQTTVTLSFPVILSHLKQ